MNFVEYINSREDACLPLFEGDNPSTHDIMRWAGKRLAAEKQFIGQINFGKRRHGLFIKLYLERIKELFPDTELRVSEKCYVFGGYKFYPETNEMLIDDFKIERGFVFIDRLLRNLNK